jgi:hypothetical protein
MNRYGQIALDHNRTPPPGRLFADPGPRRLLRRGGRADRSGDQPDPRPDPRPAPTGETSRPTGSAATRRGDGRGADLADHHLLQPETRRRTRTGTTTRTWRRYQLLAEINQIDQPPL